MTLLEHTYMQLHSVGLVRSTAGFSTQYLHRNRNWYAWQVHTGRDMSAAAAVQCLRSVRAQLKACSINSTQRQALAAAENVLLGHLRERHAVADVCA
jgi:hypothetical protein